MKAWCKPDILFHHMKCVFCFRHRVMDLCLCVYFRAMSKNYGNLNHGNIRVPPPKPPPQKGLAGPTKFIPLFGPKRCPWGNTWHQLVGFCGESSPWIFLMQIQDANLKRPVVLKPGNSSGGGIVGKWDGLLVRASSGKWTSCISASWWWRILRRVSGT